jgi:uncharacterized protein YbjT (DUF2867 family)
MTRVVLTGAMGTIGSAVCVALLARGNETVALSRDPERARAALGDQVEVHARTEPPERRPPAGALAGADAVVHLLGDVTGDSRPAVLISVGDRLLRPQRQRDVLGDR